MEDAVAVISVDRILDIDPNWRSGSRCTSISSCDHAGGLAAILRTLSVGMILDRGQVYGGRAFNDGMGESRRHRVPVEIARCGDQLWFDPISVAILSPCTLTIGGTGDPTERRLVTQNADIEADVRLCSIYDFSVTLPTL